jgi:FAD/FMN-containing dehydrogenase
MADITDFEYADISEAVEAVTGDSVVYTSIDDEHTFWFILSEDWFIDEEDSAYAECLDDLYPDEVLEKVLAYLEANYESN